MPERRAIVSVIIPAYNTEKSLSKVIDSAIAQMIPAEIIVINDGSTDKTSEVARFYRNHIYYLEQTNQGQGAARNAGIRAAQGEFIAFLDADDYWLPGFLERCVYFLNQHPEVIAVNTGFIVRDADGNETIFPKALHGPSRITTPLVLNNFFSFWAEQDHVRTGTVLIRKSIIDQAGDQRADLRVSQDLEYWGYLATFGPWGFIPEPLWVGNSRAAAASGWLRKYHQRRKLCPTVELWEKRIVPRLQPEDRTAFNVVRGRVAAGYAQNKILGGASGEARHIVEKYGETMPNNWLTALLRTGARYGAIGWQLACWLVKLKETTKALGLNRWVKRR
ncbi:MAG: glycosyltransferase family A protein [Candidatus Competibacter denitrificans]